MSTHAHAGAEGAIAASAHAHAQYQQFAHATTAAAASASASIEYGAGLLGCSGGNSGSGGSGGSGSGGGGSGGNGRMQQHAHGERPSCIQEGTQVNTHMTAPGALMALGTRISYQSFFLAVVSVFAFVSAPLIFDLYRSNAFRVSLFADILIPLSPCPHLFFLSSHLSPSADVPQDQQCPSARLTRPPALCRRTRRMRSPRFRARTRVGAIHDWVASRASKSPVGVVAGATSGAGYVVSGKVISIIIICIIIIIIIIICFVFSIGIVVGSAVDCAGMRSAAHAAGRIGSRRRRRRL